jgi:hypothetical protein
MEQLPKPGYFNTKPLLKAISDVKTTMGLQDSCIQTNQVAILQLEEQAKKYESRDEFIKELCSKFRVSVGTRDFEYFKKIQYKSYISQTYNLVETFFKDLNKNYRLFNNFTGDWIKKDGDRNLDPFNQLLANLPNSKRTEIKSYPEYHLFNYYRLIRNSIAHLQEDPDQDKKTSKYYDDHIVATLPFFQKNYEITAPNSPEKISFDDFMLYTRAVKYFSNILNDVCFPEVTTLTIVAKADNELQKNLLQSRNLNYEGALLKRINVLRSYFHKHFSIHHKELRDEFCKAYLDMEGIDYSEYL